MLEVIAGGGIAFLGVILGAAIAKPEKEKTDGPRASAE